MTEQGPKRLIEVDLPIRRISNHARREKSIRHGHISTLHIWWARRPLAACRAVILAGLLPDPGDDLCPQGFRDGAMSVLAELPGKRPSDDREALRTILLDFIADFANWDLASDPTYIDAARRLVGAAYPDGSPLVVDPFAGGGAIPLEALRVGAQAWASDLNPVAVLLEKVVIEYMPRYGDRLADAVRRWGEWVRERARAELDTFYPIEAGGAVPIAYIWARTALCEGPGCGVRIPLMRGLALSKRAGQQVSLQLRAMDGRIEAQIVKGMTEAEVGPGTVKRGALTCPACGHTTPVSSIRQQARRYGLPARLMAVVTTTSGHLGRGYRLPTQADLDAIARAADELEMRKARAVNGLSVVPVEPLPPQGTLGFRIQAYGFKTWGDLFSARQALALSTFARLVRESRSTIASHERDSLFADAVATCLALAVDREADFLSTGTMWATNGEFIAHTFGRQALPLVWDFAEANPFGGASGDWMATGVEWVADVVASGQALRGAVGTSSSASATHLPLPDACAAMVCTDPPYYDAIAYADLSDYFYVWLKRSLGDTHPDLFSAALTPKDEEIVVNPAMLVDGKRKLGPFFLDRMRDAFGEARRILADDGIAVVVFAHKSTSGWEAILQALVDVGWMITGSWPVDTERPVRLRTINSAALASSVHLVCRPRAGGAVGEWGAVLRQLQPCVDQWMERLAADGVVGADAIFACLGPALALFSRYDRVETAAGDLVPLVRNGKGENDFLTHVWAAISRAALRTIFADADASGFEPDGRLAAVWLWTTGAGAVENADGGVRDALDEVDEDDEEEPGATGGKKPAGFLLPYDTARKLAQPLGADLEELSRRAGAAFEVKGSSARMLGVRERRRVLLDGDVPEHPVHRRRSPQAELFVEEAPSAAYGAVRPAATTLDRINQAMLLFAEERGDSLRRFLVDDGVGSDPRFWRLAQAFSALYPVTSPEKRWVDGVLARKRMLNL